MTIQILTTGGTIDKIYFDQKSEYHVGEPQAGEVLARANVTLDYEVKSILKKDSLDFTDDDRAFIQQQVERAISDKILITHGTDGMVATAKALQNITNKTIILTGAMLPAQFRDTDAVFNLGCALTAVQTLGHGVYIVMNGRIFNPDHTRKNVKQNRFEANNSSS